MNYDKIKKLVYKIKSLQKRCNQEILVAVVELKSETEYNRYELYVFKIENIVRNLFTNPSEFEEDVGYAKKWFEQIEEITTIDKFIEKNAERLFSDYIYEYGEELDTDEEINKLIELRPESEKLIRNMYETKGKVVIDNYSNEILTLDEALFWLDDHVLNYSESMFETINYRISKSVEYDISYFSPGRSNNHDYEGGYFCTKCGDWIDCKCEYDKTQAIMCEKCLDKEGIVQSIISEIY